MTVNRTAGRWFACFSIETGEPLPPVKKGATIGVDVGINKLAVCSDGTVVENPRALAPALRKLRKLDKAIARSRKVHGRIEHSNRRERLYARRRRLHARICNVRNDAHHKATTAIAKPAGRVVIEDLNVSGMMQNRRLARSLADAGYGRVPQQAGVQVRLVRDRVRKGGPVVPVIKAVFQLRDQEPEPDPL